MVKAGVIDPAKVTRLALQNAASIAGLMLTTEALMADIKEDDKRSSSRSRWPRRRSRRRHGRHVLKGGTKPSTAANSKGSRKNPRPLFQWRVRNRTTAEAASFSKAPPAHWFPPQLQNPHRQECLCHSSVVAQRLLAVCFSKLPQHLPSPTIAKPTQAGVPVPLFRGGTATPRCVLF